MNAHSVAAQLKRVMHELSPAERRVARAFLADYPVAGLEPVARLAERAHVSAPTVLRMISKLGYDSYPLMQQQLRQEISERNLSPLDLHAQQRHAKTVDKDPLLEVGEFAAQQIAHSFQELNESEFYAVARLLQGTRGTIWITGGRYSALLGEYLALHLRLIRSGVRFVADAAAEHALALLDIGADDTVLVFDYRRYQCSSVAFAAAAKRRRARVVVFTDPWLSPAVKHADYALLSRVEAKSPFDSLAPAMAVTEALIAEAVKDMRPETRARIKAVDDLE